MLCMAIIGTTEVYGEKYEPDYTIRNIRHGDGIVDAQINCIMKDHEGYLWFGTASNVLRFDGTEILCFDFKGNDSSSVNSVVECGDGSILAGCDNGIWMVSYEGRQLTAVYPEISSQVSEIRKCGREVIALTGDGVYSLGGQGKAKRVSGVGSDCISVCCVSDKESCFLFEDGITIVSDGEARRIGNGNIDAPFTCMKDVGDRILVGTDGKGIYSFDKKTRCFSHYLEIGNNCITSLDANGNIMAVGTDGTGVTVVFLPTLEKITFSEAKVGSHSSGISFDSVKAIMVDELGIIWIGYNRNVGFDYIQFGSRAFRQYSGRKGLPDNIDFSSVCVRDSVKLFGSFNGIYSVAANGIVTLHPFHGSPRSVDRDITCIHVSGDTVYAGTSGGVYFYTSGEVDLKPYPPCENLHGVKINMISDVGVCRMLIGSDSGLFVLDNNKLFRKYPSEDSDEKSDKVNYIFKDRSGDIWISTSKRIGRFNIDKGLFIGSDLLKESHTPVTFMSEDLQGRLIVVKDRREAFLVDPRDKSVRNICSSHDAGFLGLFIEKVLQDRNSNYWFIGSRGVVKATPSLSDYTLFSTTEGFVEPYSNDGVIHNDTLWVCTPKGVLYSGIDATILPSPTRITDVIVNGVSMLGNAHKSIMEGKCMELPTPADNVTFSFATLSYDIPSRMIYEYKLEGFDSDWKILRGVANITYRDLPPGVYRFVVRKQMDNTSMESFEFRIPGPPLPVGKAIVVIVAMVICSVVAYFFLHARLRSHDKEDSASLPEVVPVADDSVSGRQIAEGQMRDGEKYRGNRLDCDVAVDIQDRLRAYMETERPYLNPELKLINVAEGIGTSPQILSQVLNTTVKKRFNDYINGFRVEEFKNLVSSSDTSRYTLQSLARKSGFSSYSTFFRAFKEITGQTPVEYMKRDGIEDAC